MENKDNIELRSEKVRNIIGQIPPKIIRIGTAIFFSIFCFLLLGAYFFQFEPSIKTTALLTQKGDTIYYHLKVSTSDVINVKPCQKLLLNFDKVLKNTMIETDIQYIDTTVFVSDTRSYMQVTGQVQSSKMVLVDKIEVSATIFTDRISIIDWLLR